jgi:hypothetical protein
MILVPVWPASAVLHYEDNERITFVRNGVTYHCGATAYIEYGTRITGWIDSACDRPASQHIYGEVMRDNFAESVSIDKLCYYSVYNCYGPYGSLANRSGTNTYCTTGWVDYFDKWYWEVVLQVCLRV